MNKKAQRDLDWEEIIKLIVALPILLAIIGAIIVAMSSFNQPDCSKCPCDCSAYQNNLTNCTKELLERPVIQNITYVLQEKIVEVPVYKERLIPVSLNILAFLISLTLTIKLFKIKFSKEIEDKIKKYGEVIRLVKLGSLIVSILIFIRLIYIFFSLF